MNKTVRMSIKDGRPPSELCNALYSDYDAFQIFEQYKKTGNIAKECIAGTIIMFFGTGIGFIFIKINPIVFAIIAGTSFTMLPLLLIIGAIVKKGHLVQYCNILNQQHRTRGLYFECRNYPYIDITIQTSCSVPLNTECAPSTFKSEQIDKLLHTPLPSFPSQPQSTDIKLLPLEHQYTQPVIQTNNNNINNNNNNSFNTPVTLTYQTSQNNYRFFSNNSNNNNYIVQPPPPQDNDIIQHYQNNYNIIDANDTNQINGNTLISKQSHAYRY